MTPEEWFKMHDELAGSATAIAEVRDLISCVLRYCMLLPRPEREKFQAALDACGEADLRPFNLRRIEAALGKAEEAASYWADEAMYQAAEAEEKKRRQRPGGSRRMSILVVAVLAAIFAGEILWLAKWPEG